MKNISKNTKTVLFASLVTTFVTSLGLYGFAEQAKEFIPQPETQEEAERAHLEIQVAELRGESIIGKNNEIDTDPSPHPMKKSAPGEEPKPLTPEPGGATDNYYGSKLNKLTSSMDGAYSKNEVHDNGYTLADGTTLYAPTLMSPGNSPLEIVTAYYNPTGSTWNTLDKLYVYDHVTNNWEYSDTNVYRFMK